MENETKEPQEKEELAFQQEDKEEELSSEPVNEEEVLEEEKSFVQDETEEEHEEFSSQQEVEEKSEFLQEETQIEVNASDLIKQQALQSAYVDKLTTLLNKDELTDEDVQTVDFVKSQLLGQLLGVVAFSATLGMDDSKIMGADVLSSHLKNAYVKAALLREKMERKRLEQLEKMDVADAYFGPRQESYVPRKLGYLVTDAILEKDNRSIKLQMADSSPVILGSLMLMDFLKDPEARLKAMMPDLFQEFDTKTTAEDKQGYQSWAEKLVTGLSEMKSKGAMQMALQGVNLGQSLARMSGLNELGG